MNHLTRSRFYLVLKLGVVVLTFLFFRVIALNAYGPAVDYEHTVVATIMGFVAAMYCIGLLVIMYDWFPMSQFARWALMTLSALAAGSICLHWMFSYELPQIAIIALLLVWATSLAASTFIRSRMKENGALPE